VELAAKVRPAAARVSEVLDSRVVPMRVPAAAPEVAVPALTFLMIWGHPLAAAEVAPDLVVLR
jgi:hypothetical protein